MTDIYADARIVAQRHREEGAAEERAKIVAWLRSDKIVLSMDGSKEDIAASAIEAGEHMQEQSK